MDVPSITLSITEASKLESGWRVKVSLGDKIWTTDVLEQMSEEAQDRLRWSLEDHALKSPFETQKCEQSLKELDSYSKRLFESLGLHDHVPKPNCNVKIVIDITEGKLESGFHQVNWEVLENPSLWSNQGDEPYSVEVRRMFESKPVKDSTGFGNFNILYVVARPWDDRDMFIDHRLISRGLVQTLDKAGPASVQVNLDIVRPGTWSALVAALERSRVLNGRGYYDLIHFDMHGSVQEEEGQLSYFFEFDSSSNPGSSEPINSTSVAKLLRQHRIRAAVLNTCESANARVDGSANLAKLFMKHGIRTVVAMSYKLSVTAAQIFFNAFYLTLFGKGLQYTVAAMQGRKALKLDAMRRSRFGVNVQVHDWIVPVCYVDRHQPSGRMYPTRAGHSFMSMPFGDGMYFRFSPKEKALIYVSDPDSLTETTHWQEPTYADMLGGLIGRDWEILQIEYQLMQRPNTILLLSGAPGSGKSALAKGLPHWWIRSRFSSYASYLSFAAADFMTKLEAWTTRYLETPDSERYGMPWVYVIDDIESDRLPNDDKSSLVKLERLVAFIKQVSSKVSKFILISRQHSTVFRLSKLVAQLQELDYLIADFQLQGLSHVEASSFGVSLLKAQNIVIDATSQADIPYLERLYDSVDRLPGGIEWLLNEAKAGPGYFKTRLHDLHNAEETIGPWRRVGELYSRLYEMKGNEKAFMATCLIAFAGFPSNCPSKRHWEHYISWMIRREPGLFPPIEVSERTIQNQRDVIRRHEQLRDRELKLEDPEDIRTYIRFVLLWDDLLKTFLKLEQFGLILESDGNIGRPAWIHPGLSYMLRRLQTLDVGSLRGPVDRAFAIAMIRSYVQTQRRDHINLDEDSHDGPSAAYKEKNMLIRKDIRNYLRALEIGQALAGESFGGEVAFTFNHFAVVIGDVLTALNSDRYEIELRQLFDIGLGVLSKFLSHTAIPEPEDAEGTLALLVSLQDIGGFRKTAGQRAALKNLARVAIQACSGPNLSAWSQQRLWLVKSWFSEGELDETDPVELEAAFGEYEKARLNFKILGFTRPLEAVRLFEQFEIYQSAWSRYIELLSAQSTIVPMNGLAELEHRIMGKKLKTSRPEDKEQIFAYARCLFHDNSPDQMEPCYQVETLRLQGRYGEAQELVSDGLEQALRTGNSLGELSFRKYFLETTDQAPEAVVLEHLEHIARLEQALHIDSHWHVCCACWYPAVQADIALRTNKPKKLLTLALDALSKAVFQCTFNMHVYRTFEYLEHASALLEPGLRPFLGLCLTHKIDNLPPVGSLAECCDELFQPCIEAGAFQGGFVFKYNKVAISEMAALVALPAGDLLQMLFRLYLSSLVAAYTKVVLDGADMKTEMQKEMQQAEEEALVGMLEIQTLLTPATFAPWAAAQVAKPDEPKTREAKLAELGICGVHGASNAFALLEDFDLAAEVKHLRLNDDEGNSYPLAPEATVLPIREGRP